jgi:hypothetical protein
MSVSKISIAIVRIETQLTPTSVKRMYENQKTPKDNSDISLSYLILHSLNELSKAL